MAITPSTISLQVDGIRLQRDLLRHLGPIPRKILESQDWVELDTVRWLQSQMVRGVAKASGIPARVFRANAGFSRRPVPKSKQRSHPRFNTSPREAWVGTNPVMAAFLGKVTEDRKRGTVKVGRRKFANARRGWSNRLGPIVLQGEKWEPAMVEVTGAEGVALGLREQAIERYQTLMLRRMGAVIRGGR